MPALTTVAVTNWTTSGATITFNNASIDCNVAQLRQLYQLLSKMLVATGGTEGDDLSAVITLGVQG